jgi:hypothetical protein
MKIFEAIKVGDIIRYRYEISNIDYFGIVSKKGQYGCVRIRWLNHKYYEFSCEEQYTLSDNRWEIVE